MNQQPFQPPLTPLGRQLDPEGDAQAAIAEAERLLEERRECPSQYAAPCWLTCLKPGERCDFTMSGGPPGIDARTGRPWGEEAGGTV